MQRVLGFVSSFPRFLDYESPGGKAKKGRLRDRRVGCVELVGPNQADYARGQATECNEVVAQRLGLVPALGLGN